MMIAVSLGVACGLFFGEYCEILDGVGDAYVGLLQMTVLPYIVFSLIANIGRLSLEESKRLTITGLLILLVLWAIGLAAVWLLPLALPAWESGSFFSTSLLEPVQDPDLLSLFIPSNPFRSLSSNFAPAVVVFCMFFGFALIHIKNKETMMGLLDTINATLTRVNNYIIRLSPIGIFAISASATGTITLEEFGRLQAYFLIYGGGVLLLTLWVLPMLVAAFTPFSYRDLMATSRNVLVTVFVIGSVFVVIPMLVESIKELFKRYKIESPQGDDAHTVSHPEFIVPLAYPFPHLGKIVTLIFIPFAAWFYGQPMEVFDYPALLVTGISLSFGNVVTTIPFLLDMQELPADIFQLFLMSSVVAGRLNDLLGAAHLLAFTALTTCAMSGLLALKKVKLIWACAVTVGVGVVIVGSTQFVLHVAFKDSFSRNKVLSEMQLLQQRMPTTVLAHGEPNPLPLDSTLTRTERTMSRQKARIGFSPDNLPFSYYNARGELVGFDIDMAHRLARDAELEIEFVPFAFATLKEQLNSDNFDAAMSGIGATAKREPGPVQTTPYLNVTLALVVRDHDKREFSDPKHIRQRERLVIGVKVGSYFAGKVAELYPQAEIVELWSESQFFEGPPQYMDALVTSAEAGSAWTLVHPEYSVVTPENDRIRVPLVYLVAGADKQVQDYLDSWILLKKEDGTIDSLYDYWILGRGVEEQKPRWSIIRDVLHWVD
jgi:Na+/H+-dicarboxylate symporter